MNNAIQVTHLNKHFLSNNVALNDINLHVNSGELIALIGPSGSGKSTLLRHLCGLTLSDKTTDAAVTVCNNTIQQKGKLHKKVRQYRSHIGLIFQQFNLVRRLSVLQNVLLGGLSRMPWYRSCFALFSREEKRQALTALERVGLADLAWQQASTLSGGQQQRVAIARALMQKASVILADEPIASLDPASARQVMDILKQINRQDGITVVITLHQVEYAMNWCDRAVALKKGHIWFDKPTSNITQSQLHELYGSVDPSAEPAGSIEEFPQSPAPEKYKTLDVA